MSLPKDEGRRVTRTLDEDLRRLVRIGDPESWVKCSTEFSPSHSDELVKTLNAMGCQRVWKSLHSFASFTCQVKHLEEIASLPGISYITGSQRLYKLNTENKEKTL
jgi:hypothetical protein